MANLKRLGTVVALVAAVLATSAAWWQASNGLVPKPGRVPPPTLPSAHPLRWPSEPEWVVHQVVREIAAWALFARGAHPELTHIRVRRGRTEPQSTLLDVELSGAGLSGEFTLRPQPHAWAPEAYTELTRGLLAVSDGASGSPANIDTLLLNAETSAFRRADSLLFAEMTRRPRDPRLHEQAALLFAAYALRESGGYYGDERAFLNGLTSHLALARTLRAGSPLSRDGELAATALAALVYRQVDAMRTLDRLWGEGSRDSAMRSWVTALRLRVTMDPRQMPGVSASRLERLEAVRALYRSQSCRAAVEGAEALGLRRAADWVRELSTGCVDPESRFLAEEGLRLQSDDAARMLDIEPAAPEATGAALLAVATANTQQPAAPVCVVPPYLRAEAGLRHLTAALEAQIAYLRRFSRPDEIQALALATANLRKQLPLGPFLEFALQEASAGSRREINPGLLPCPQVAALISDRPDLVPANTTWVRAGACRAQPALAALPIGDWGNALIVAGTGWLARGPWQQGPAATGAALAEARERAPWSLRLAQHALQITYRGEAPASEVLHVYERLLPYDLLAMQSAVSALRDDDDEAQRLAERICDGNPELCANYAEYMFTVGREESGTRMAKRALESSRDAINLSVNLGGYVNCLLNRHLTQEALRVARLAADVASAGGLSTLGHAYERLGRLEEAEQQYARITERYRDSTEQDAFYLRYRQRYGTDRYAAESGRALATLFPHGLQRKSLADFRREGGSSLVFDVKNERLRRAGLRGGDRVLSIDGFVVENVRQLDAVMTFTDEPRVTAVVLRAGAGVIEVTGPCRRWQYGPVIAR